jgi:hypothetical protein
VNQDDLQGYEAWRSSSSQESAFADPTPAELVDKEAEIHESGEGQHQSPTRGRSSTRANVILALPGCLEPGTSSPLARVCGASGR